MEKSPKLSSSSTDSFEILCTQSKLENMKKTYNSASSLKLPDKGAKLKKYIDELENRLQALTLKAAADNKVSLVGGENSSKVKQNSVTSLKEIVHDEKALKSASNDDEKRPQSSSSDNEKTVSASGNEGKKRSVSTDNKVKDSGKAEHKSDNLPFCKASSGSGNQFLSFGDLAPKHKEKTDKTGDMSSPSFKSWRKPEEVRKVLLTEPKPLIEKSNIKKSSLHSLSSSNPIFQTNEECVKKIHHSLATYPDDCEEEAEPENLKSTLMVHQKKGLAWLMWREQQDPKGGILADDMGLGKTLSIIALVLKQKERRDYCVLKDNNYECKGTLIVCSASIIHQWNDEIIKHCEIDALKVLVYHGPKRDREVKKMKSYDVVLTTYNLVQTEKKSMDSNKAVSPLFNLKWERIVLDEAHTIKNHNAQTAQAVFSLQGFRRWAVTGTPIHNVFKDVYALVKFLQFSPFDDLKKFKSLTDDSSDSSEQRRNLLMKSIVLRRTKDQVDEWGKPLIEMKNKSILLHYIELSAEETRIYDGLNEKVRSRFTQYLEKNSKMKSCSLLVLLLRLQQCCNHLSLLKTDAVDLDDSSDVADALSTLNIDESSSDSSDSGLDLTFTNLDSEKLDIASKSTKISKLFEKLHKIFELSDSNDKCVIVSQWVSMLDIVAFHLRQEKIAYHMIAGSTKVEDRQKFTHDFNNNEKGAKVMLLSLKAGGVGLNLVGANHLFLLDLHWNPALEMQACDRIHRVGQKKDVSIHKFICKHTIEEKINELQNSKRRIASNALHGAKQNTKSLTIDDYKMLFGIRK